MLCKFSFYRLNIDTHTVRKKDGHEWGVCALSWFILLALIERIGTLKLKSMQKICEHIDRWSHSIARGRERKKRRTKRSTCTQDRKSLSMNFLLDPCARVNCNHGRCEPDRGIAVCRCYQGYSGSDCLTMLGRFAWRIFGVADALVVEETLSNCV